jgi:serine O-acetyltransferase
MLLHMIGGDLRRKALWCYGSDRPRVLLKVLCTDGTMAMIFYRLMQWSRRHRLVPLEMLFNKLNTMFCNCIIGRGAEFGPGFVLVHATGTAINGGVRGGSNVTIYHQVTVGGERGGRTPILGNDVLIASGAKVIGPVRIGDGARVTANSVVFSHVPPQTTVMGIPARPVWRSSPLRLMDEGPASPDGPAIPDEQPGRADRPEVAILRDDALRVANPPASDPVDWPPSGGVAPGEACGSAGTA